MKISNQTEIKSLPELAMLAALLTEQVSETSEHHRRHECVTSHEHPHIHEENNPDLDAGRQLNTAKVCSKSLPK